MLYKIESMTKNGHQKFWVLKWKFFPEKGHSKIWFMKFTRRQVSTHGLEPKVIGLALTKVSRSLPGTHMRCWCFMGCMWACWEATCL